MNGEGEGFGIRVRIRVRDKRLGLRSGLGFDPSVIGVRFKDSRSLSFDSDSPLIMDDEDRDPAVVFEFVEKGT